MHFITCLSRTDAWKSFPGANRIIKVKGGFIAFDSANDYFTWRNQR